MNLAWFCFPIEFNWPLRENVEVFMKEFAAMEHYCRRGHLFCDGWSLRCSMAGKKDASLATNLFM